MEQATVRVLTESDGTAFFNLRLEGLRLVPTAFGGNYEDELAAGPGRFTTILTKGDVGNYVFGAFLGTELVGCIGVFQESGKKSRHRAMIWGMYVKKDQRGKGIGKLLVLTAIAHARTIPAVGFINLTLESGNTPAKSLYTACGFKLWGTELSALLVDGKFHDEDHMFLKL